MAERIGLQAIFDDAQFKKGIQIYIKTVDEATKTTEQGAKQMSDSSKQVGQSWQDTAQEVGVASAVITAALTAALTKVTLTAARTEELGIVLERVGQNIGKTADQMHAYEEGVKAMGITTQASRQALIQMVQAQIDLSHATTLARLAQDAAVIAQLDSSEAFERLITVIQRGSPLMARTLGLVVDFQGAYERWAEANNRVVDSLTAAEKIEIRAQNVMENAAQITGTYEAAMGSAGKQMRSMNRYVQELSNELGDSLLPVLGEGVQTGTKLLKWALDMDPALRNTIVQTLAFSTAILAVGKAATFTLPKLIAMVTSLGPLGIAGALATAGAALLIYGRQMEDMHEQEAASIAETAESYDGYLTQLENAELGSFALSEGLYAVATGADAAAKGLDVLALTEAWQDLKRGFGYDVTGIQWLDDFLESLPRATPSVEMLTQAIQNQVKEFDAAKLAVAADADAVEELGRMQGYTGQQLEDFVRILTETAQTEIEYREMVAEGIEKATSAHEDWRLALLEGASAEEAEAARLAGIGDAAERAAPKMQTLAKETREWRKELMRQDIMAMDPYEMLEGRIGAEEAIQKQIEDIEKRKAKAAEDAEKERVKAQEDALREMEQNERSYAGALASLYDQIVATTQRAQEDRIRANEEYTAAALALAQRLAQQEADIERDLARELEDIRRDYQQDREDEARDLARELEDLERDLAQRNADAWADYYQELEDLAERHGERMQSIEERYADKRADIEDKYRTEKTADELRDEEREALLDQLEELRRLQEEGMTGIDYTEAINAILAQLDLLKQEELDALAEAQAEEEAQEEAAYQEEQRRAEERRQDQLDANQDWYEEQAAQRQRDYERRLEDLRIAEEREGEERRLAAQRALDDLRARGEQEAAELAAQHQARLDEIERELAEQRQSFRDAYDNELRDLQTYLAQREQDWRNHLAAIQALLGVGSPSKWMENLGQEMSAGLKIGWDAPSLSTDLEGAIANFGQGLNNLGLPAALPGAVSSTSTTHNHNLSVTANYSQYQSERSLREDINRQQMMMAMRTARIR